MKTFCVWTDCSVSSICIMLQLIYKAFLHIFLRFVFRALSTLELYIKKFNYVFFNIFKSNRWNSYSNESSQSSPFQFKLCYFCYYKWSTDQCTLSGGRIWNNWLKNKTKRLIRTLLWLKRNVIANKCWGESIRGLVPFAFCIFKVAHKFIVKVDFFPHMYQ